MSYEYAMRPLKSNTYKYTIQWVSGKHRINRLFMGKVGRAKASEEELEGPEEPVTLPGRVTAIVCTALPSGGGDASPDLPDTRKDGFQSSRIPAGRRGSPIDLALALMAFKAQ